MAIDDRILRRESKKGVKLLWEVFPRSIHTFQYIRKENKKTSQKHSSIVRTYDVEDTAWADALRYNLKGYDVYWMVNEGDGTPHEGHQTCRSQDSVTTLTACFIDTDNCDQTKIDAYLTEVGITPHLVVESSPERYHYYFVISPELARPENISQWQAIQHMLHRLGNPGIKNPAKEIGMDSTMHDYSKVLRVPGFTHVAKMHTVRVVEQGLHEWYGLDDLYALCEGSLWDERVEAEENSRPVSSPAVTWEVDPDAPKLEAGERFQRLQTLSLSLANDVRDGRMTEEEARDGYEHFVLNGLLNDDETYAADYQLTEKSWALWRSALGKVRNEKSREIAVLSRSLDAEKQSPWNLPDSFYTSAPGGFGDVVKQVMGYSLYPCAALAFGTFLTGLSVLKAQKVITPHGSSPALYTLNVAISGYGKGDPMVLLQNMFYDNGMSHLISNEIRSDRGIYEHFNGNDKPAFYILDEIAPLLRAIQREDANTHQANISKAILHLFSAAALKEVRLGKVAQSQKGKSAKEIIANNPKIAICGFTVPEEFKSVFNADSVAKGLFQRFIPIVPEIVDGLENEHADNSATIKSDLFTPYYVEQPEELPKKDKDSDESEQDEEDKKPVPDLVTVPMRRCRYSTKALPVFRDIQRAYRSKMIAAALDPERAATSGLYSRLAEQVERVATVLAQGDEIDLATLEYAAKFMETRHSATLSICDRTVLRGEGSKGIEKEDRLINAICKLSEESGGASVGKREVYGRCRRSFRDVKDFDSALDSLAQMGKIQVEVRKDSRKYSKPQTMLRLTIGI